MKTISKKLVIITLIISMIVGCTPKRVDEISFTGLDDIKLHEYVMEDLYASLNAEFDGEDYEIEQISAVYVSKEYLEELDYNSKSNIYFGFTEEDLANLFQDKTYVFNVNENNETVVEEFKLYSNNYHKIIKNVLIGTGVILFFVTASSLATGTKVATILFSAAKTAKTFAISSTASSGIISTAIEYYNTKDINKALEKGLVSASEGYKWGAIIGAVAGGTSETIRQFKAAKELKTMDFHERGLRSEARAYERYGGRDQVSYLNGEEVPASTIGATKPDIVREVNGYTEAIEVKNYNLNSALSRESLYQELTRQVSSRVKNLPSNFRQRIVLDVQGRNYNKSLLNEVINNIKSTCSSFYKDIPVDVMY